MRAAGGAWGVSEWAARGDVANIGSLPTISNAATAEVLEQLFEQPTSSGLAWKAWIIHCATSPTTLCLFDPKNWSLFDLCCVVH